MRTILVHYANIFHKIDLKPARYIKYTLTKLSYIKNVFFHKLKLFKLKLK